jgi:hypothetical protein
MRGATALTGGSFWTSALVADCAVAVPTSLVAVTRTRSAWSLSASPRR